MKIGTFYFYLLLLVWPLNALQALEINIDPAKLIDTVPPRDVTHAQRTSTSSEEQLAGLVADARRFIDLSEQYADSRYLGFADGVLAAWKSRDEVPAEIRLLRAILAQKKHQFVVALQDLKPALQEPELAAEAWFVKAMVHQAMGDHAEAVGSCYSLGQFTASAVVSACLASEFESMGQSDMAWSFVPEKPLRDVLSLEASVRQWVLTVYAEVSVSHNPTLASDYFKQAMAITPRSPHLLRVYAQHLLDQGQAPEVLELLDTAALDAPLHWLQCQALSRTNEQSGYQICVSELVPRALVSDENNKYIYPELIEQMGLSSVREIL